MAMIDDVKILTKSTDTSTLELLITQCKQFATDYCNLDEYSTALDEIVKIMVCEKYNRLTSEGINTKNYSGVSESYLEDFSSTVYRGLRKKRKLRNV